MLIEMSCILSFQKFFIVICEHLNAFVARREQVKKKKKEV